MMNRVILFAIGLILMGCGNELNHKDNTSENTQLHRNCAAHAVLEQQLQESSDLQNRMEEIERFTEEYIASHADRSLIPGDTLEIPVIVNVLWRTPEQNISDAQIASQIVVLNNDFSAANLDYNSVPEPFVSVKSGDIKIRFVLAQTIRKKTFKSSWLTNDFMKQSSKGGLNPTLPTTHLNIWVCNMANGILGYAQFPGGQSATDGVVIDDNAMGTIGTVEAPFDKGRTATHEVGHWMNLRHIWGDATCGSDLVGDTPAHNTANYGCPSHPHLSTCSGQPIEMWMNYMDYTNDACMYMFSQGQKARMLAVFAAGGPRESFAP